MFHPVQFGAKYQVFFPQEIMPKVQESFNELDDEGDEVIVLDLKPTEVPHDKNNPETADLLRRRVTVTPDDSGDSFTFETSQKVDEKNWDQHLIYGAIKRMGEQVGLDTNTLKQMRKTIQRLKVESKADHIYVVNDYHLPLPEGIDGKTINNTTAATKFNTFLGQAIKQGKNDLVQSLLAHSSIDPNKKNGGTAANNPDDRQLTPITMAIKYNNFEALNLLLQHPKTQITTGTLFSAIEEENLTALEILLKHPSIDINKPNGTTTPLYKAVQGVSSPAVVKLLAQVDGIDPNIAVKKSVKVDKKDVVKQVFPPIGIAASKGYTEILETLLAMPTIDVNALRINKDDKSYDNQSPLHLAIRYEKDDAVELLFNDPRVKTDIKNGLGKTPIDLIFEKNRVDYFKTYTNTLTDEALNTPNEEGITILARSLQEGKKEFAQYLIEDRQIDLTRGNDSGITPLHLAAMHGQPELVEYMINQPDVDPFVKDSSNWTPFHWAVYKEQEDVANLYINRFNTQIETLTQTDDELIEINRGLKEQ